MPLDPEMGPLQMRILGILGDKEGLSGAEVQARLAQGGHHVAYTTVVTVMGRLYERKLVVRQKDGKKYVYRAAKRSGSTKDRILQSVHRALFEGERLKPIATLVRGGLTRDELQRLRDLIDEKLGDDDE